MSSTVHGCCFTGEGTFFGQNLQGSNSLGQSIYCDSFETGLMMGQPTILVRTSCLQHAVQCWHSPEAMEGQRDAYHCSLQAGSLCTHCLQLSTACRLAPALGLLRQHSVSQSSCNAAGEGMI